jgi:hypothetical protein
MAQINGPAFFLHSNTNIKCKDLTCQNSMFVLFFLFVSWRGNEIKRKVRFWKFYFFFSNLKINLILKSHFKTDEVTTFENKNYTIRKSRIIIRQRKIREKEFVKEEKIKKKIF